MNQTTKKMGWVMALTALASLLIYTVCFVGILFVNEPFVWIDLQHFAAYEASSVTWMKYLGMGCMLLYACAFLVLTLCVRENTAPDRRIFAAAASAFGTAFCVCVCFAYFVQMTSTRLQLQTGHLEGLLQFTQSYNISAINGVNMLGWTMFYGLSSLGLGLSVEHTRSTRLLRVACVANTAIMFIGFAGDLMNDFVTLLLAMNLGLGIAGLAIIFCLLRYFRSQMVISVQ